MASVAGGIILWHDVHVGTVIVDGFVFSLMAISFIDGLDL